MTVCRGLDVDPGGGAVVGQRQVTLKVALRGQDQRLLGAAGSQPLQVLAGEAVQPGQPVRAVTLTTPRLQRSTRPALVIARCSRTGSP